MAEVGLLGCGRVVILLQYVILEHAGECVTVGVR